MTPGAIMNRYLPDRGKASSYSDYFEGKPTASGQIYSHKLLTAAILPRARWGLVPMRTKVKVYYKGRSVVVTINDKGAGDGKMDRVLDLSRAAMSALAGWELKTDEDAKKAGVIDLDKIEELE